MGDLTDASRLLVLATVALLAYVAVVLATGGGSVALLEVVVFALGVLAVLALFARYETR